ncbi:Kynurenine formamidase [Folsomia candida]|uniref:Kynurenine formamidase n=1 Tax=Folsomia candida TaxID=158441 RepID=A0A226F3E0_FOLCA|nr:Kynurenine formamidase [Folsomia candida]
MSTWENYSPEELIKQMSVSHWTPDRTPEEVMNQHIQNSLSETKSARDTISNKLGIAYGEEATQIFDEYGTELKDDALIFFWIHGGYWQEGTKEIAGHMAPNLVARGVRNVVVEYSLAPKVKVAEIQEEIIQALRKVGEMFPKAKIVVGGG